MKIRVGLGYDVHQLVEGREFWLGGILVPHSHGALGHSDADVLIHAICDALLGAVSLRDIGYHFSDKDERWRGVDSKLLLRQVVAMLHERGWQVGNVDATLVLEAPRIGKYVAQMQQVLADIMHTEPDAVSIKATTSERMGFVGRHEGVEAQAVALVIQNV